MHWWLEILYLSVFNDSLDPKIVLPHRCQMSRLMKKTPPLSERYSFSAKRMEIVSTLPALSKAPIVSLFSALPVKFPIYPAKESPWWFLCWIHGVTYYWHRLWVSCGSSLKSGEEGLNTTTTRHRCQMLRLIKKPPPHNIHRTCCHILLTHKNRMSYNFKVYI